jgi:hypothetical protein
MTYKSVVVFLCIKIGYAEEIVLKENRKEYPKIIDVPVFLLSFMGYDSNFK